ncbi:MAG: metallophosphatase [Deltaproteobacteria bacterium]|nr:metallophosphatase [Deltaproteobacteria bacterium]
MTIDRRRFLRDLTAGLAAPVLLPALGRAQTAAPSGSITLLHTNDTHSRIDPFPEGSGKLAGLGGVARRATLIRQVRRSQPHTLLLDGGDFFQGTPYFNRFRGEVEVKALSALGYDVVTIGNHDLDIGTDGLEAALAHARFDLVNCNYEFAPELALGERVKRYVVREVGGVRVGVFGLGVALEGLVNLKLCPGVRYRDPIQAARAAVEELRLERGCHMVVALTHLGHRGVLGEPGDLDWPRQVAGVNYVVGGHTHTFLEAPINIRCARSGWQTLVMQVGYGGVNVGRADFVVERGKPQLKRAALIGVGGMPTYA